MATLADLAAHIGAVVGEGARTDTPLSAVRPLHLAQAGDVSFLDNPAYAAQAKETHASAVIVHAKTAEHIPDSVAKLIHPNPYVGFAKALAFFNPTPAVVPGVAGSAAVSPEATVHETARVEPGAVVYPQAELGAGVHIGAHTVVGEGVKIGAHTRIAPHVTLLNCTVGEHCLIHSGVRIGQDGFGFAQDGAEILKVPQVGGVVIGNDVEIGANTTIDRGALADTVIEDSVKLDCQVQIAHNVRIGHHTRVVSQVGVAGSATLGAYSVVGGQSGIAGHVTLADKIMIAARSGVTKSNETEAMVLAGFPAMPMPQWRKLQALLSRMAKGAKVRKATDLPAASAAATATSEKPHVAPLIGEDDEHI